jgi:L-amino acid N-acyltransferase YncA
VGKLLYEHFFAEVQQLGRRVVKCVTSPVNKTSIAFHLRMGFVPKVGDTRTVEGVPFVEDYDGKGESRVVFCKQLTMAVIDGP